MVPGPVVGVVGDGDGDGDVVMRAEMERIEKVLARSPSILETRKRGCGGWWVLYR